MTKTEKLKLARELKEALKPVKYLVDKKGLIVDARA